jgi:hypothetical protein
MRKRNPKYKKIDLITKVVEMTCNGISQHEVIDWLSTEAECGTTYCYDILKEAKPIIMDALKDISKDRLEATIVELEKMMTEAKGIGDKKLALDIKKEINKIAGLHNQKIDITTGGEKINQISVIKLIEYKKNDSDDKTEKE